MIKIYCRMAIWLLV